VFAALGGAWPGVAGQPQVRAGRVAQRRDHRPGAEVSVLVGDSWQRSGVGALLDAANADRVASYCSSGDPLCSFNGNDEYLQNCMMMMPWCGHLTDPDNGYVGAASNFLFDRVTTVPPTPPAPDEPVGFQNAAMGLTSGFGLPSRTR
jgi:hypothetical protein